MKILGGQRGVALITVLLVMVIAIALVSHAIVRDQISINRSGALLANTQLAEFVEGAEAWSRVALLKDFEEDKEAEEAADHALEAWASPALQFNPDNGKIRINIKDLNSCFNVNNLVDRSANDQFDIFRRLVSNVTGKPELAVIIADWVDDDDTPRSSATEDDGYLGRDISHRTPDTSISDVSELSSVQGIEAEDWQKLAPFLCALPETGSKININFASQELVEAIDPSASISKLEQLRESGEVFSNSGDLSSINITKTDSFVFHSQHFLARIAVQLGDGEDHRQYWETVLRLEEGGEVTVKVVQRQRRTFSGAMMQELLDYDGTAEERE
ncbi:type II secretion system protein K [Microbulbifer sp. NBRC 101763]|uniref:type II secretion system minor pseudopilin GspK n=1 Tax=Microbulbifer sp. NBRC 101763 TaxID=1113820 RepID=UPI00309AD20E